MLDNLLDGLAPGRFGISSDRPVLVDTLNNWSTSCADREALQISEEDVSLRAELLSEEANRLTQSERFTDQDAGYLRNCLLCRDLVDATVQDARTDRERVVGLFYQLVQGVDLRPLADPPLPLGPYETALFGWGSAEDRALLFGMTLRQLRLDAVVIRPKSGAPNLNSLLIGVILPDEGVLLFDMALGLPLTAPSTGDRTPLPLQPVTLADALKDDQIFRQYDLPAARYPLQAEQLKEVEVLAIGEPSTWAPRLGWLQAALPASLEVYDGLAANALREQGLIERLVVAGNGGLWNSEAVGIWDYPESIYARIPQMTPEQHQQIDFLGNVLKAPWSVRAEQQNGQLVAVTEPAKDDLHQARILDLQGDHAQALNTYLRARLAIQQIGNQPFLLNRFAANWAAYWAALTQFDQGDYMVAGQSAEQYLKDPMDWVYAARLLQGKSLAHQELFQQAADVMAREARQSPQRLGNQWLARRWRTLAESSDKEPKTENQSSPATPSTPASSDPATASSENVEATESRPPTPAVDAAPLEVAADASSNRPLEDSPPAPPLPIPADAATSGR